MGRMYEFQSGNVGDYAGSGGIDPKHGTPASIGGTPHAFDTNKGVWVHQEDLTPRSKTKVGDRVQLGEPGSQRTGQIWGEAPGAGNWHAVDEGGAAHIFNDRSESSRQVDQQTSLANYRAQIDRKYSRMGTPFGSQAGGRRLYPTGTEAIANVKSTKARLGRK